MSIWGPSLRAYVESLVKVGRYNSKSEVLREGVRLVQEREAPFAALDGGLRAGSPTSRPAGCMMSKRSDALGAVHPAKRKPA